MDDENKKVEVDKINFEKRFDGSALGSTVVKYVAYVVIFFGLLYFITFYILPMFK
jgi:hypothetical protein